MSKRKEQSPGPNLHGGAQDERTRTMKSAEIVALAVQGVPGTAFQTRQVADMAVTNMALRIRNQVADGSLAMRTLEAVPILATIEEIALEESSKRYLVTFRPDRVREGYEPTETIRTDRTDGWRGDSVRKMWAGLTGRHVRLYKLAEPTGNPEHPKVRVAPYVEVIGDDREE